MAAVGTIAARWALRGKTQGQADDYRILSDDSDGRLSDEYARLTRHLTTGDPKERPSTAGEALPWATMAPLTSASAGERFGVALAEWPNPAVKDAHARPTVFTRYYDVALAAVLACGLSYEDLYLTLGAHALPGPARLDIAARPTMLEKIARSVDRYGFLELAATAAGLLEGSVALTGPAPAGIEEKLGYLDAVVALLPYGVRADLSVGTWSPNMGTRQPLRLFFSDIAASGQRAIRVGGRAGLAFTSKVASDYLDRITRLWRAMGTEELVEVLWAQRNAFSFHRPSEVLDCLSPFDLPYAVWQDVRRGAGVGVVRAMLALDVLPKAEPQIWTDLVQFLVEQGTKDDLRSLARHWCPPVAAELARLVFQRGPDWGAQAVRASADAGQHGGFVDDLIAAAGTSAANRQQVIALLSQSEPPPSTSLRAALLNDPDLTARLLLSSLSPRTNTVGSWLGVLESAPSDAAPWLQSFLDLRRGAVDLRDDAVKETAQVGGYALLALFALARHLGRERGFLRSTQALGGLVGQLQAADDHFRRDAIDLLHSARDLAGVERCRADVLLSVAGAAPSWRGERLPVDASAYTAEARELFDRLSSKLCATTLQTLVDSVLLIPISVDSVDFAVALAEGAPEGEAQQRAFAQIGDAAAANPMTLKRQPRQLILQLQQLSPRLRSQSALFDLEPAAADGAGPDELARLCAKAIDARTALVGVLDAITPWPHWGEPRQAHLFLRCLADELVLRKLKKADDLYGQGVRYVLSGGYGLVAAAAYREWLRPRLAVEKRRNAVDKRSLRKVKPPRRKRRFLGRRWFGARRDKKRGS